MKNNNIHTIDEYLQDFPKAARNNANELRAFIRRRVGGYVQETIKDGRPTLYFGGKSVQFVIHDDHIGFFPGKGAIARFEKDFELLGYGYNHSAVRFSINEKLPYNIIENILLYLLREDR